MSLTEYVMCHAVRGACQCGKCIDAPPKPETLQPIGHTADLVFFKVAENPECPGDKVEFTKLAMAEHPHWFDGKEHGYLEAGANIGNQGVALLTMGYGAVLGVWKLMTPTSMVPHIDHALAMQMAGAGYITIQAVRT